MDVFYIGTHQPQWTEISTLPLFISMRSLRRRPRKKKATCRVAIDSAGFSELSMFECWKTPPTQYADEALQVSDTLGTVDWFSIQDWMCEPPMLAKTGKTIAEHQALTIESYATLRDLAPSIAWAPVLQGWRVEDYLAHARAYADAGFDLGEAPVVGVGSVCRRQATKQGAAIFRELAPLGFKLHAFGIKSQGLQVIGDRITSADSMAWSFGARKRRIRMPGCAHACCNNCFRYAMHWGAEVAGIVPQQTSMPW